MAIVKLSNFSEDRQCPEGILPEYLIYTDKHEAPRDFHLWTCLGLISVALGRDVYFPQGDWELFPNLYIILVGDSGITRKSTTLKIGVKMLREALDDDRLHIMSQKLSPEYFCHRLGKLTEENGKSEATIHASELSVLLGKTKLDDSFIKILTDLYDCPDYWDYGTIGRGEDICNNVFLTVLGGSTPEWLKNSLPEESLAGGFFSRLVLVHRQETGFRNPHPQDVFSLEKQKHRMNIINDLRIITRLKGPMRWDRDAKLMYEDWYWDYNRPEDAPHFMKGYYGRKTDFLIKTAMLLSLSGRSDLLITPPDFLMAQQILAENEDHIHDLSRVMATTQSGQLLAKIRDMLKRNGVMAHSKLMQNVSHQINGEELRVIIETLEEEGKVVTEIGKRGKKIYHYKEEKEEKD